MKTKKHSDLIFSSIILLILFISLLQTEFILNWLDTNFPSGLLQESIKRILINQVPLLSWLLATFLIIRYSELLFWQVYFPKKTGTPTPKIIIDIYSLVIWLLSIGFALSYFFNKDVTGLLTASSVVMGVLGFSLRGMIADFFYGLAITLEQPYRVGDWIEIRDGDHIKIGKVKQIAWRSTLIVTSNNIHVTVPNSVIANSHFNNYSYPDPFWCSSFTIILGNEISGQEAERIFFAAVKSIKELADIGKEPKLSIHKFLPQGIEWRICFWVKDYPMEAQARLKIQQNILRDLNYCGITLPREGLEVFTEKLVKHTALIKERNNWARNLDLFSCLSDAECQTISQLAIRSTLIKDAVLFEQGSAGSSLFLVYQGLLNVFVKNKVGINERVNQLGAGSVFGEMSLLTGDLRNATVIPAIDSVVYEVNKAMIEPYLRQYPLLLAHIEQLLAERKMQTLLFLKSINKQTEIEITRDNALMEMQQKIRRFFNL